VKKFIDEIARYKLNVLHLHLTDDQGGASRSAAGRG
jgi:N-acetyl-beta-hexosaminidase